MYASSQPEHPMGNKGTKLSRLEFCSTFLECGIEDRLKEEFLNCCISSGNCCLWMYLTMAIKAESISEVQRDIGEHV